MASTDMDRAGSIPAGAPEAAGSPPLIPTLVVDEFPISRLGLTSLLNGYPGLHVVAEADDASSAERAARRVRPGLVVIDPVMGKGDAFDAMSSIRVELPQTRILVLAKSDDLEVAARAIGAGADGFLVKTVSQNAFLNAVQRLLRGETVVSPELHQRLVSAGYVMRRGAASTRRCSPRSTSARRRSRASATTA
jgi:DNA-binding NarL/FixJ family response regulator